MAEDKQKLGSFIFDIEGNDSPIKKMIADLARNTASLKIKLEIDQKDLANLTKPITIPVKFNMAEAQHQLQALGITINGQAGMGAFKQSSIGYTPIQQATQVGLGKLAGGDAIGGTIAGNIIGQQTAVNVAVQNKWLEDKMYKLAGEPAGVANPHPLRNKFSPNWDDGRIHSSWTGQNDNQVRIANTPEGDAGILNIGRKLLPLFGITSAAAMISQVASYVVKSVDINNALIVKNYVNSLQGIRATSMQSENFQAQLQQMEASPFSFFNRFRSDYKNLQQMSALSEGQDEFIRATGISNRQRERNLNASIFATNLLPFEARKEEARAAQGGVSEDQQNRYNQQKDLLIRAQTAWEKHKKDFEEAKAKTDYKNQPKNYLGETAESSAGEIYTNFQNTLKAFNKLNEEMKKGSALTERQIKQIEIEEKRFYANTYRNLDMDSKAFEAQKRYELTGSEFDQRKIERIKIAQNYLNQINATGDKNIKAALTERAKSEIDWTFSKPMAGTFQEKSSYDWLKANYENISDINGNNTKDFMKNFGFGENNPLNFNMGNILSSPTTKTMADYQMSIIEGLDKVRDAILNTGNNKNAWGI